MKKQTIVIFGSGGHAKVIADIIALNRRIQIAAFIVPNAKENEFLGYPVRSIVPPKVRSGLIAIGDNWKRSNLARNINKEMPDFCFVTAIHPDATVADSAEIGEGTVVMAGARLNPATRVGAHCIINTQASLDHDSRLFDFASLGPGATIGGACEVGKYSVMGIGSTCIHGIKIGCHTVVGAGAVVVNNVPKFTLAVGNPCRALRKRKMGESYL